MKKIKSLEGGLERPKAKSMMRDIILFKTELRTSSWEYREESTKNIFLKKWN